jgi:GT2 family glycosyltransferase
MRKNRVNFSEILNYPNINPVSRELNRPFWSVMIPTYNSSKYLERCLKSVLNQDPGPAEMQIEVVDNGSTDNTVEIVRDIGKGRISLFCQPGNLGVSANWTTCIREAKGHWVHILHGDDMLLPGFYHSYGRFIENNPDVVMVCGRAVSIDENDEWKALLYEDSGTRILKNPLAAFVKSNPVVAPTAVVRRTAYEKVGGFAPSMSCALDLEMWMRLAESGPIGFIGTPHFCYRINTKSAPREYILTAKIVAETALCIQIAWQLLPSNCRDNIIARAMQNCAYAAGFYRSLLLSQGEHRAAMRHAIWAWRLRPSLFHARGLLYCAAHYLFHRH